MWDLFALYFKSKKATPTQSIVETIYALLQAESMSSREIEKRTPFSKDDIIFALQELLDKDRIHIQPNNEYSIK